jgi:hypothetical protein
MIRSSLKRVESVSNSMAGTISHADVLSDVQMHSMTLPCNPCFHGSRGEAAPIGAVIFFNHGIGIGTIWKSAPNSDRMLWQSASRNRPVPPCSKDVTQ